jgi:hypothetical protein
MDKKYLKNTLEEGISGLLYVSETDSSFSFCDFEGIKILDKTSIRELLKLDKNTFIEEREFEAFFDHLTNIKDWYGERERKIVERFSNLKILMEKNLTNIKVFRIGKIRIDIYIIGFDSENRIVGIKTKSVET